MTKQKAVEILSHSAHGGITTFDPDFKDAMKLGIEALLRLINLTADQLIPIDFTLPGETSE